MQWNTSAFRPETHGGWLRGALLAGALLLGLTPAAQAQTVLRVVPQSDLRALDPVWTTSQLTQAHGLLVYDQLFALDSRLEPKPQMVDRWQASEDGLVWTFTLRPGLRFSDGSAVTARDVVPSIRRWAARSADGQLMMTRVAGIEALDDSSFRITLSRPYGALLTTLANPTTPLFIMRQAEAGTDPFRAVSEIVGSGPFMYMPAEHQQGVRVVYRRNPHYVPRAEPPDGMAGGRVPKVDVVEWHILPDPATAVAALTRGEVDVLENTPYDLLPVLQRNRAVRLTVTDPLGQQGMLRFNSLAPPFNDSRVRQAVLWAVSRPDYLNAMVGNRQYERDCASVFICGTASETSAGAEPFARPDLERARRALREAGYANQRIVLLDPADYPVIHAETLVTADRLRAMGFNVDLQAMDWSSVVARRSVRDDPASAPNGWHIFHTINPSVVMANPITNYALASGCHGRNWFGWPCDEELERLRVSFADAGTPEARRRALDAIQTRYFEVVPFIALGQITKAVAHRANVSGFVESAIITYWNVEKN